MALDCRKSGFLQGLLKVLSSPHLIQKYVMPFQGEIPTSNMALKQLIFNKTVEIVTTETKMGRNYNGDNKKR